VSTTDITLDDIAEVDGDTLDAWLNDPDTVATEDTVYICIDGKTRREYREVKERIAERRDAAVRDAVEKWEKSDPETPANGPKDDRMNTKRVTASLPPNPEQILAALPPDHEQPLLEQLVKKMKTKTIPFLVRSVGSPRWNELIAAHPPRKDPGTGRIDQRDLNGGGLFNVSTFYVQLVRESIVKPAMTDARYAALLPKLDDTQFTKIAQAAADLNAYEDNDLPF
jgi:hypothetical protein